MASALETCSTATSTPRRRTPSGSRAFPHFVGGAPTCVRTWAGFVYVAFIIDVFAQRIVSWHAMNTKHTDLVPTCSRMATWRRERDGNPVAAGLIVHSDAGSQSPPRAGGTPTSLRLTEHLAIEGIAPSVGSVGDAYDNALVETVIGLDKTECIRVGPSTPVH